MQASVFLEIIGPLAQNDNKLTGIPASITLAQAILESGWGSSKLATLGKNLFGIKADPSWNGPVLTLPTKEWSKAEKRFVVVTANWRKYQSWEQSLQDHSKFFYDNPRYKPALKVREEPQAFADALQKCGYATDPNYADLLWQIVEGRNLVKFDQPSNTWALLSWATLA